MTLHNFGRVQDKYDLRDYMAAPAPKFKITRPIDLSPKFPYIFDQGQLGTCYAFSTMEAIAFDEVKQGLSYSSKSPMFIAYNTASIEGTVGQDAGGSLRDSFYSSAHQGICHEEQWPYLESNFGVQPPSTAYADAAEHKVITYRRLTTLDQAKAILYAGWPISIGVPVFNNWPMQTSTGKIPMPGMFNNEVGGHAILLLGFDPGSKLYKFANSWNTGWGDKGYGYFCEKYLNKYISEIDMWQVSTVLG